MSPPPPVRLGATPEAPPIFARLSEEQAEALVFDRELSVVAGAGAGKTSTLAARYVTLLHARLVELGGPPEPTDVLVLTFTEKAAAEMRERCLRMVNEMLSACERAAAEAAGLPTAAGFTRHAQAWAAIRDRFPAASIHTFHGFCTRIIKEFPAESGTPPGATTLENATCDQRLREAAAEAVSVALTAGGDDIRLLLESFGGAEGLLSAVGGLLSRRGEVRDALARIVAAPVTDAAILAEAGVHEEALRRGLADCQREVAPLLACTPMIDKAPLVRLRAAAAALPAALAGTDVLRLCELRAEFLASFEGSGGGPRNFSHHATIGSKADLGAARPAALAAVADLQPFVDSLTADIAARHGLPTRHDRTHALTRRALAQLVQEAEKALSAAFDRRGELDFAELIARARRAVVGGGLAAALSDRHRYVMVDEFQDTDVDQWSLVQAITRDGEGRDRLFVVGDPKQSIYGFRGGDVAVFERARQTIAHKLFFADNHRSRPAVVDFANSAFAAILGGAGGQAWQIGYQPMRAASPRPGGSVILATAAKLDPSDADGDAQREAAWVARTIRERILGATGPWAGTNYADAQAYPSPPIAILLRRRTKLPLFEAALRAEGVSVVVDGGAGFWQQQEVLDCAHALLALSTGEPISVVGTLRSPFFGVPDRDILLMHRAQALAGFGREPFPESLLGEASLVEAHARWVRLRADVAAGGVAAALQALLVDSAAPFLFTLASPGGQAEANVQRLLELADAADEAGQSAAAFAQGALDSAAAEVREGEASLPDTGARVSILTVHGSKGLEYPVVIVPELGGNIDRARPDNVAVSRAADGGWDINCVTIDRYGPRRVRALPGALHRARRTLREMNLAEQRRIFYVACTRAIDSLVLVGVRPTKAAREGSTWLSLLDGAACANAFTSEDLTEVGPVEAPSPESAPEVDLAVMRASLEAHVGVRRLSMSPSALAAALESLHVEAQRPAPRAPTPPAPTAGLPDQDPEGLAALQQRGRVREVAAVRGTVIHSLLEDECLHDDTIAAQRWRSEARLGGLDEAEVARGWGPLHAQLEVMRSSPDVAAVLAARGHAELPLRMELAGVRIDGRLDRLCLDPIDQRWMVVDYKTEDPGTMPAERAAQHRVQLLTYSVAASRVLTALGTPPVARAAVLFTRTGELVRLADWTPDDAAWLEARVAELVAQWSALPVAG